MAVSNHVLGLRRRKFLTDPTGAVLDHVRVLNSSALDELPRTLANARFQEAEDALERVIADDGATPARVHYLVVTLLNDAQANAFCGKYGRVDLGRALGAAEEGVRWQRELVEHACAADSTAPPQAVAREQEVLGRALLTLARVQVACALEGEARRTFSEAEALWRLNSDDEARALLRSVGEEVGADLSALGGPLAPDDRTDVWFTVLG